MEFLRARRERRHALTINDPKPVESVDDIWAATAQMAVIGIFIMLLGACLYFCRPLLLPILAAMVIAHDVRAAWSSSARGMACRRGSPRSCSCSC